MHFATDQHILRKTWAFLLAGLLFFPTQVLGFESNLPAIRIVARAEYLTSLGQSPHEQTVAQILTGLDEVKFSRTPDLKPLALKELILRVAQDNQQILQQKAEWRIRQAEAAGSRSIFEPELLTSLVLEDHSQRNSVEESLSRLSTSTYSRHDWKYNLSLQALAPTGGNLSLGYNLNRLSNSLTTTLTGAEKEYQMDLGLNLRQPLLKNAGVKTTRAGIMTSDSESQVAFQEYRLELMQRISSAVTTYWEFHQAQEQLNLRKDSLKIAEQITADSRERLRAGKMAETDVLEASIGVNTRSLLLSEAEHLQLQVSNRLRNLLSVKSSAELLGIRTTDKPAVEDVQLISEEQALKALSQHPEYLAAQHKLEQTDIKIAFSRNQRQPELDLLASYGLNGLDLSADDSWQQIQDADFASWSLGMQFRMPLRGGIADQNELKKAEQEKRRQTAELKEVEIELANRIDTALDKIFRGAEQLKYAERNSVIQKQLLETELARMRAGKSGSRQILEKEDSYRLALETSLKSRVKLQIALTELQLAEGTILQKYGLDITGTEI